MASIRNMSSGKMCRAPFHQTKATTSAASSKASVRSKTKPLLFLSLISGSPQVKSWEMISPLRGVSLTRNIGEFPNEENVSSLSQILQEGVPEKYYLSPKACQGILRRASVRGKKLPAVLEKALLQQASA